MGKKKTTEKDINLEEHNSLPMDKSNQIEQDFNLETVKRMDEQFLELERDKLKAVSKFIEADVHEKSQIKSQERKVLPIIQSIAKRPFQISQALKYNKDNPFWIPTTEDKNVKDYEITVLDEFLKFYFQDGISIDRAGRKETVDILRGLTNNPAPEIEIKKENKLMR